MAEVQNPQDGAEQQPEADDGPKTKKKHSFWRELPILIGVALLLTFLIQTFFARVFVIPSESMEQTLHGCDACTGDRVLVDKVGYWFGEPESGDVVVFQRPPTWRQSEFQSDRSENAVVRWLQGVGSLFGLASPNEDDFVKRVVATAGQTVECCDTQGRVMVDGKPLDEPYIYWSGGEPAQDPFGPVTVPDGHLYVMGDNRNHSADSRKQGDPGKANGFVPVDNVIGKVRSIVLPPGRWQGVGDHDPQTRAVAMSAPAWQQGIPAGIGLIAAWPVLALSRRSRDALRGGLRSWRSR